MVGFLLLLYNELPLRYVLLYSIYLFMACGIFFFILLLISRLKKINEKKQLEKYTAIIDRLFYSVLFGNTPVHNILEAKKYRSIFKDKKFRNMLVQNVTQLHLNYTGPPRDKLEEFYRKSGLINISFEKLKSKHWEKKCEGIRELTRLNVKEAFYDTYMCMWHPHDTLKLEALLGLIRLEGVDGLGIIHDYPDTINDWIQLNLLYEIDKSDYTAVKSFTDLLTSKNESVVVLGLRLSAKFNQIENLATIRELQASSLSESIKTAAAQALDKLPSAAVYTQ